MILFDISRNHPTWTNSFLVYFITILAMFPIATCRKILYLLFICSGANYKVAENWTTQIQVPQCSTYCRYSTWTNVSSFFTLLHTACEIWFHDHHFWHKHIFPVSVKTGVQPQRYKWFHSYVMRFHCTCHFYSGLFSSDIFPESPISDQHFFFLFFFFAEALFFSKFVFIP